MKRDGVWYFHKLVNGKRIFAGRKTPFSLDTRDLVLAKAKRDALLKAANGAEVDRVLGRSSVKVAAIQAVLDAFTAADWPREQTRKKYMRDFKLILRRAWGEERDLSQVPVTDLTAEIVHSYQDSVVAGVRAKGHGDQGEEMQVAKYTANRTLTQARAIFASEKPFRKLRLPPPTPFLEADLFKVKRDLSYVPMTAAEMTLFGAESALLKEQGTAGDATATGVYLTWICMRWLGLRNSEVRACKPAEWLFETPRGWVMRITNRPYFMPKGVGSVRDLPVVEWLRTDLQALSKDREWLVPSGDRRWITDYAINDWIDDVYTRAMADGRLPAGIEIRTAYDFRKQAGSELYEKTKDILMVSKWLGHQSVLTTTKWYVNLIRSLPSLA